MHCGSNMWQAWCKAAAYSAPKRLRPAEGGHKADSVATASNSLVLNAASAAAVLSIEATSDDLQF